MIDGRDPKPYWMCRLLKEKKNKKIVNVVVYGEREREKTTVVREGYLEEQDSLLDWSDDLAGCEVEQAGVLSYRDL
ncbi:hypothetical protein TWF481_001911 [Arthrobotrys musiformis]|uniref:Uncharacterized protein n=1 Tax=Arthrobotrys musiformis TaxID=47236 RepID=A0AAV9VUP6_9PEZI